MWDEVSREKLADYKNLPIIDFKRIEACPRLTGREIEAADEGYKSVISKLRNIFIRVSRKDNTGDYHVLVATRCGISPDIVRRIILPQNKKSHKALTQVVLGCICVGLQLSKEECEELFDDYGTPLVFGRTRFLSVTMCAIRDKDDISSYIKELQEMKVPGADRLRNPMDDFASEKG